MSTMTITASSTPLPTQTSATNPNNMESKTGNSPLLFFVALGFGVLFTNLWIIIGVKYCFRYQSARRRGVPMNSDGVALGNLHNGRRRREKKLMTMEEVESQFPLMTYKTWRSNREKAGLSTEGGVKAVGLEEAQVAREALTGKALSMRAPSIRSRRSTASRAASLHSIEPVETPRSHVFEFGKYEGETEDITSVIKNPSLGKQPEVVAVQTSPSENGLTSPKQPGNHARSSQEESRSLDSPDTANAEDDEADAQVDETEIQHLPDNLGSGDTCAICIEQLEEDDEIRGLTCGHAFHCTCVDVWLTTRRAICPLCKKDYWVRRDRNATTTNNTENNTVPVQGGSTRPAPSNRVLATLSRMFPTRERRRSDLEAARRSRERTTEVI